MLKRLRSFVESLVYAGLKPSGGVPLETKPEAPRRFGKLRDKIDLFLSGGLAPTDPLYLTNRTWKQKLRLALVIATPTALLFCALGLVFTNVYSPTPPPPKEVSAAEIMAKLLPDLQKTANVGTYKDAEVTEVRVLREGAPRVAGIMKNKTGRVISVEFDLDLANLGGSRVATTTQHLDKLQPNSSTPFEFPAGDPAAAYALIREIRTVQ
jgi:hypothetical protein